MGLFLLEFTDTHRHCAVDNGGVAQSIREDDDRVALVCIVTVPVSYRDLQRYVFLRGRDDCSTVLPANTVLVS